MKKDSTNFKFIVGKLSVNDPFTRLVQMEGNKVIQNIYKTETKDALLAQAECLRELSNYVNKIAGEYEKILNDYKIQD